MKTFIIQLFFFARNKCSEKHLALLTELIDVTDGRSNIFIEGFAPKFN